MTAWILHGLFPILVYFHYSCSPFPMVVWASRIIALVLVVALAFLGHWVTPVLTLLVSALFWGMVSWRLLTGKWWFGKPSLPGIVLLRSDRKMDDE